MPTACCSPNPLPLDAVGRAYTDGTAQFRGIAKAINLQPQ
jgi:hypothetical protein